MGRVGPLGLVMEALKVVEAFQVVAAVGMAAGLEAVVTVGMVVVARQEQEGEER